MYREELNTLIKLGLSDYLDDLQTALGDGYYFDFTIDGSDSFVLNLYREVGELLCDIHINGDIDYVRFFQPDMNDPAEAEEANRMQSAVKQTREKYAPLFNFMMEGKLPPNFSQEQPLILYSPANLNSLRDVAKLVNRWKKQINKRKDNDEIIIVPDSPDGSQPLESEKDLFWFHVAMNQLKEKCPALMNYRQQNSIRFIKKQ